MKYIIFLSLLILFHSCTHKSGEPTPPNIVIIMTDDQGYQDLGCFGSPDILTPHIDQMAREGVIFTDFYAAQPVCSASRAALLTGCYPNRIGVHGAYMPNSKKGLNPSEVTIAEMLKEIGYTTAIFGKWHLGDAENMMPGRQGFDEYFGIPYSNDMWPYHPEQGPVFDFGPLPLYHNEQIIDTLTDQSNLTQQITQRSVDFIHQQSDRPFMLYVAHPQPHVPLFVSDQFKGKSKRGLYGDVIMEIDWSTGQIIKALKDNHLDQNTLVLYTSDNGPWLSYGDHAGSASPLREGKGTAWEGGQREPTILYYPSKVKGGRTIHTPMMNIDVLPTIAELTGAELPNQTIDGKSMWQLWTGEEIEHPHEAYYFYYKTNELHGIRYKNWKMYFPHEYRTLNSKEGGRNGLPVSYEYNTLDKIELYNLQGDISEMYNVADDHPDVVDTLTLLAQQMRERLGDKLLNIEGTENRAAGRAKPSSF